MLPTLAAIATGLISAAGADQTRPNILLILADDLGYGDLRCYNPKGKIPTPNLNRLAAENNFRLPLERPIRIVNLDNWPEFLEKHGEQNAIELLKRLREIGYQEMGGNMAGKFCPGYGYLSFADFLINANDWSIRLSQLEKMKADPDIRQYYLYIDYPGQMEEFMKLSPDRQADVFTKVIQPAEKREGFTFVYPILFDDWDATKHITSPDGPYHGASIFDVIRESIGLATQAGQPAKIPPR
jgi:hypothetical protein